MNTATEKVQETMREKVQETAHPRHTVEYFVEPIGEDFAAVNEMIYNFLDRTENAETHKGHLRVWRCTREEALSIYRTASMKGMQVRLWESHNGEPLRRSNQPDVKYAGKFRTENRRGGHRR